MQVLIAVNESAYADVALEFVLRHNWGQPVKFMVLTVVEPLLVGSYMSVLPSALLDEMRERAEADAVELVHGLAEKLRHSFPESPVEEQVLEGLPKEEIVNMAKSWPADFIVVGSHGRRGINRLILGSTSQAVCSLAPCSVLIARLHERPADIPNNT